MFIFNLFIQQTNAIIVSGAYTNILLFKKIYTHLNFVINILLKNLYLLFLNYICKKKKWDLHGRRINDLC